LKRRKISHPDAAVCPRIFHWILSRWKLQDLPHQGWLLNAFPYFQKRKKESKGTRTQKVKEEGKIVRLT